MPACQREKHCEVRRERAQNAHVWRRVVVQTRTLAVVSYAASGAYVVERWRAELFGDQGSLNDKLVRTAVA